MPLLPRSLQTSSRTWPSRTRPFPASAPALRVGTALVRGLSCAALLIAAACGGDPALVPSVSTATASTTSTATVASSVGTIPSVKITDSKGRAVKDVMVRWRVASGGGKVVNDSVRTSPAGEATSGGWTLGTLAGTQTLTASADGVPTVTFSAEAAAGAPARLQIDAGIAQRAAVNTLLPIAPAVRIEDLYGNPVRNVPVTFSVLVGGGTLTGPQQTTNAQGIATVGGWRLGTISGDQIVRVTSGALGELNFSALADPGPLADLSVTSGTSFDGATRAPTPRSPTVRTVDAFGNAVGNVGVTFTPGGNSGGVSSTTVTSDAVTGLASVVWTLGSAPNQTMVASSVQLPGKTANFTSSAFASDYDIEVRFVGTGGTTTQREAFAKSVIRWRRLLTRDLHDTRVVAPAGECAAWVPALNEVMNDLVIYARLVSIDGPGRVLGQAGPCYVNGVSNLTAMGLMEFDLDDLPSLINNGTLDPVVLHEVGHVLGIGTLWNFRRTLLSGAGGPDPYFVGTGAGDAFKANGGMTYAGLPVPVENTGGAGTRDAHWRRTIFGRELMQGFSSPGAAPLSSTTAASLADLGYPSVLLLNSDNYTFGLSAFFESPAAMVELQNDVADLPLIEISANGTRRVVRTKRSAR